MSAKKFYGPTLHNALRAVKDAYGQQAVILSARELDPTEWRPLRSARRTIEVVACGDPLALGARPSSANGNGAAPGSSGKIDRVPDDAMARHTGNGKEGAEGWAYGRLDQELQQIHGALRQLMLAPEALNPRQYPPLALQMARHLTRQGLEPGFVQTMIEGTCQDASVEELDDPAWLERHVRGSMESFVVEKPITKGAEDARTAIILTGPAGVGKSSCIAKIAAFFKLDLGMPVRVGVVCPSGEPRPSTLMMTGQLLEAPVDIIENIEDIPEYVRRNSGSQKVLVEAGLPERWSRESGSKSVSVLASCPNIETQMVLSSATKLEDLMSLALRSKEMPVSALGFTKLDETATLGCVFETARKSRLPVSFFSIGRQIPEDLLAASARQLVEWITDNWQESRP